jgi:glutathione synthase/RimK-type ligase-like ATP-grasp enzyme
MGTLTVGLASCAAFPELTPDDRLLLEELRRRGADARAVVWDSRSEHWAAFDTVVIRSCWDYHLRPAAFLDWLKALEAAGVRVWNPVELIRQNMHKGYLRDFAREGVSIVPTVFLEKGANVSIADLLEERGWPAAVVKPAISASAFRTSLVRLDTAGPDQATVEGLLADGDVLIQCFMPEIRSHGEWSLVFVDGEYSHGVVKRPAPGDFRVQTELGGSAERRAPPKRLLDEARAIAARIPEPWLYMRIDGLELGGTFTLMEMELIEPFLFLADAPAAPLRLADALLRP